MIPKTQVYNKISLAPYKTILALLHCMVTLSTVSVSSYQTKSWFIGKTITELTNFFDFGMADLQTEQSGRSLYCLLLAQQLLIFPNIRYNKFFFFMSDHKNCCHPQLKLQYWQKQELERLKLWYASDREIKEAVNNMSSNFQIITYLKLS